MAADEASREAGRETIESGDPRYRLMHLCSQWAWEQTTPITKKAMVNYLMSGGMDATNADAVGQRVLGLLDKIGFFQRAEQGRQVAKDERTRAILDSLRAEDTTMTLQETIVAMKDGYMPEALVGSTPLMKLITVTNVVGRLGQTDQVIHLDLPPFTSLSAVRATLNSHDYGPPYRFFDVEMGGNPPLEREDRTSIETMGSTLQLVRFTRAEMNKKHKLKAPPSMSRRMAQYLLDTKSPPVRLLGFSNFLVGSHDAGDTLLGREMAGMLVPGSEDWQSIQATLIARCPFMDKKSIDAFSKAVEVLIKHEHTERAAAATRAVPSGASGGTTTKGRAPKELAAAPEYSRCSHPSGACRLLENAMAPLRELVKLGRRWTRNEYETAEAALLSERNLFLIDLPERVERGASHDPFRHDDSDFYFHQVDHLFSELLQRVPAEMTPAGAIPPHDFTPVFYLLADMLESMPRGGFSILGLAIVEQVIDFTVVLSRVSFVPLPMFLNSVGQTLLGLEAFAKFYEIMALRPEFIASVSTLFASSSDIPPKLAEFAARLLDRGPRDRRWGNPKREDVDDLALWCFKSIEPIQASGDPQGGSILLSVYTTHMWATSNNQVPVFHVVFLPELIDHMIMRVDQKDNYYSYTYFLPLLLRFEEVARKNNMDFPGPAVQHRDRLVELLKITAIIMRERPPAKDYPVLSFTFAMETLCDYMGIKRRMPPGQVAARILDAIGDNYELMTNFLADGSAGDDRAEAQRDWLLTTTVNAAVTDEKYLRIFFQSLLATTTLNEAAFSPLPIFSRDDLWIAIDAILERDSDKCPHSSVNMAIWRILVFISLTEEGCNVIYRHNMFRHVDVATQYIVWRVEPDLADRSVSSEDDEEGDEKSVVSLTKEENDDLEEVSFMLGDLTISLLSFCPEAIATEDADENLDVLVECDMDRMKIDFYAHILFEYSRPKDDDIIAIFPHPINRDETGEDFPKISKAYVCFGLWLALRRMVEEKMMARSLPWSDVDTLRQLDFLRALTVDQGVRPLVRETAEDALEMARQVGLMEELKENTK